MCALRILKETQETIDEKTLQTAIENDLEVLEEGLTMIATEVPFGRGRIDTLAVDEDGRPTFIEYKRPGAFDQGALIQLMDYLSWFDKDRSHFAELRERIKAKKDLPQLRNDIRLMLVVSHVDERVKNACFVINRPVKVFSYMLSKGEGNDILVIPRQELDTDFDRRIAEVPPTIDELVPSDFRALFTQLDAFLSGLPGVKPYATGAGIRAQFGRVFANMQFQKKWMKLNLRVGEGNVNDSRFQYKRQDPDWGFIRLAPTDSLDEQVKSWVKIAYELARSEAGSDDNLG